MWELFHTLIVFVCLLGTCFSWWSTEEQDYSSLNTRNNSKLIYIYIFICILYINFETHLKHCDTVCFGSSSHFYCKISRFWYYVASSLSDNIVNKVKDNSNTVQQNLQRIWSGYLLILHVLLCRFFVQAVFNFFLEFTSGNEYVYNYESQVLTGIPHLSKQYSGIKIVSKVKIAFRSVSEATLQVKYPQYLFSDCLLDMIMLALHNWCWKLVETNTKYSMVILIGHVNNIPTMHFSL